MYQSKNYHLVDINVARRDATEKYIQNSFIIFESSYALYPDNFLFNSPASQL